jgi:TPP-dependent 2-oxoacid decarboxylase
MECLQPRNPVDATLACGTLLSSASIEASAEVDQITFPGQNGQRVTLTLTAAGYPFGATVTATLFSPTLAEVIVFSGNSQQQLTLTETGTYVLQIRTNNLVSTGSYSIGMECLQPLNSVDATLACGAPPFSGFIEASAEVDQITFPGQNGQRVTLTLTAAGFPFGATATATLFSPTLAEVIVFSGNSQQQLTLTETGTYVLQIRTNNLVSTGGYALGLACLAPAGQVNTAARMRSI